MKQLLAVSNRCRKHVFFSVRVSSSLLKCLLLMVASVAKNPTMIRVTLLCGRVLSGQALWRLLEALEVYNRRPSDVGLAPMRLEALPLHPCAPPPPPHPHASPGCPSRSIARRARGVGGGKGGGCGLREGSSRWPGGDPPKGSWARPTSGGSRYKQVRGWGLHSAASTKAEGETVQEAWDSGREGWDSGSNLRYSERTRGSEKKTVEAQESSYREGHIGRGASRRTECFP